MATVSVHLRRSVVASKILDVSREVITEGRKREALRSVFSAYSKTVGQYGRDRCIDLFGEHFCGV